MFFKLVVSMLVALTLPLSSHAASDLKDYSKLNHTIFIDSIRAGNHDPSGTNSYYFTYAIQAMRNTKADLDKEVENRDTTPASFEKFADIQILVLSQWKPEEGMEEESLFVKIIGDEIRALVSDAMRKFKVREDEIAVVVTVKMFEKNKKFFFFGEDTFIGLAKYYPIPATKLQARSRTNLKLAIIDDQGTNVEIKVKYEEPDGVTTKPAEKNSPK